MPTDPIYNHIGYGYNTTRKADPFLRDTLIKLLAPQPDKLYLDIGCGTGNYTIALALQGYHFWGVEPSEKMLNEAREKSNEVKWIAGSAEQIPAAEHSFDGAIATLTIHHWTNLEKAFQEVSRVLKPGSKLVIFTSTHEQMRGYWHNHYFPVMLRTSIEHMPDFDIIKNALEAAKLPIVQTENYEVRDDLQDCFLYVGKNNPELYFDPVIRKGISSFSAFANQTEVEKGLLQLRSDIDDGSFSAIKSRYEHTSGDYIFIVAEKEN